MTDLNLNFTRQPLLLLNNKLNNKNKLLCNNDKLKIELYEYTDIVNSVLNNIALYDDNSTPDFVICLNYNNNNENSCISSISCKINRESYSLEFSSKTEKKFEGKKYNLLLRSVLVILSSYIRVKSGNNYVPIKSIISRAVNPISILLMAKHFRAQNEDLEQYMINNNLKYDELTLSDVDTFYNEIDFSDMEFDNEEDESKYLKYNEGFGNPILLTININNENIKQAERIFSNTHINCPVIIAGKKTKKKNIKTKKNIKK